MIHRPARDAVGRRDYDAEVLDWIAFLGLLNAALEVFAAERPESGRR